MEAALSFIVDRMDIYLDMLLGILYYILIMPL
jgi:hypothetical protein